MANYENGHFVWHELLTTDPAAAIAFYGEVVGWKTQPFGSGDYVMLVGEQGPMGGVRAMPEQVKAMGAPPFWIGSVQVADLDRTLARARELGGQVHSGPEEVPEVGRLAVIGDPQGAAVIVVQPSRDMPAHDGSKRGEVCWNELVTTDRQAALAFYGEVLGWEHVADHDMGPMGTYSLYGRGAKQLGGIFDKPAGNPMPPGFFYYIQIDRDLDGAVARATKLGAKVLRGPMEVPGDARVVHMMDPQGAVFSMHENPKKPA